MKRIISITTIIFLLWTSILVGIPITSAESNISVTVVPTDIAATT